MDTGRLRQLGKFVFVFLADVVVLPRFSHSARIYKVFVSFVAKT